MSIEVPVEVIGRDEAVKELREVWSEIKRGGQLSDEMRTKFLEVRGEIREQISARRALVRSFELEHAQSFATIQAMSQMSHAVANLQNMYMQFNVAQLRIGQIQERITNLQKDYNQTVTDFGPNSEEAYQALKKLEQGHKDLQQAQFNNQMMMLGFILQMPSVIHHMANMLRTIQLVTTGEKLRAFWHFISNNLMSWGLFAAVAIATFALAAYMFSVNQASDAERTLTNSISERRRVMEQGRASGVGAATTSNLIPGRVEETPMQFGGVIKGPRRALIGEAGKELHMKMISPALPMFENIARAILDDHARLIERPTHAMLGVSGTDIIVPEHQGRRIAERFMAAQIRAAEPTETEIRQSSQVHKFMREQIVAVEAVSRYNIARLRASALDQRPLDTLSPKTLMPTQRIREPVEGAAQIGVTVVGPIPWGVRPLEEAKEYETKIIEYMKMFKLPHIQYVHPTISGMTGLRIAQMMFPRVRAHLESARAVSFPMVEASRGLILPQLERALRDENQPKDTRKHWKPEELARFPRMSFVGMPMDAGYGINLGPQYVTLFKKAFLEETREKPTGQDVMYPGKTEWLGTGGIIAAARGAMISMAAQGSTHIEEKPKPGKTEWLGTGGIIAAARGAMIDKPTLVLAGERGKEVILPIRESGLTPSVTMPHSPAERGSVTVQVTVERGAIVLNGIEDPERIAKLVVPYIMRKIDREVHATYG